MAKKICKRMTEIVTAEASAEQLRNLVKKLIPESIKGLSGAGSKNMTSPASVRPVHFRITY